MKKSILLFGMLCLGFAGCSSDSGGGGTATAPTTVSGALSTIETQVGNLVPDTGSLSATSLMARTAMTTEWTTTGSTYSLGGSFGDSPRDYVRIHGDSTANSSLMYRLNQIITNICLFTFALPDADNDGQPDLTSSSSVILTSAIISQMETECNVDSSELPPTDFNVGYQIVETTSGSEYDRVVGFDMSNTGGTSYTEFFYFRFNSTLNRVLYVANGTNDSAAFFQYNASTNVFSFEFSEFAPGSFVAHYRGVLEGNSNLGRFVAHVTNGTDISKAVVSVEEGGGDELHVSYSFDDNADTNDFTDGSACVNSNDFSIATDDSTSCSSGAITGALASTFDFDLVTNVTTSNILGLGESSTIQFTSLSDILTAGQAQ